MNSNIRAGSALATTPASSASMELSLQNPLLGSGGRDAFSQVLKQQASPRDERRPATAERSSSSADVRRDKRADSRQQGGNSLPERTARSGDSSGAQAVGRPSGGKHNASAASSAPASQSKGTSPSSSKSTSQSTPSSQAESSGVADSELSADESVLAELAALQMAEAEAESSESGLESVDGELTEGEALADEEGLVLGLGVPVANLAGPAVQPAGEAAVGSAQQQPALATSTAGQGDGAADALSAAARSGATAGQPNASADGELANWELGHEPSAADKNAERNAETARQLAAGAERNGPLKEQLAALVQQFKGDTDTRPDKAKGQASDAAADIKGPAFGRALEQLSQSRVDTARPVSTGIQTPLGQREWAGELSQRLMMMVSSKLKSAEIHLNPKDLGPVEVRIRMHEDKAQVVFTSPVQQTREALEQAVPRLREMFDQNGVGLGNVDVQDHGTQHSHQREQAADGRPGEAVDNTETEVASDRIPARVLGLVDYYA